MPTRRITITAPVTTGNTPVTLVGTMPAMGAMTEGVTPDALTWPTLGGTDIYRSATYIIEQTADDGATAQTLAVDYSPVANPTPTIADAGARRRARMIALNCTTQLSSPVTGAGDWSDPIVIASEVPVYPYIAPADWTVAEATSDANTRRALVTWTQAPPAGKSWRVIRYQAEADIRQPASAIPGGFWATPTGSYSWQSGGQFTPGSTGWLRLGLFDGTSYEWAGEPLPLTVSDTPTFAVTLADLGNGDITATLSDVDGRGRAVTAREYRIDGGAWTSFTSPLAYDLGATGVPHTFDFRLTNANGVSAILSRDITSEVTGTAPSLAATVTQAGGAITITATASADPAVGTITLATLTLDGLDVRAAASLDTSTPGTWVWSYAPATAATDRALVIGLSASNSVGTGTWGDTVTIAANATDMAVTVTDTITYDGVTVTLSRPMPVGFFTQTTGEPVIISTQDFQITSITPASADMSGTIGNGAMLDPFRQTGDSTTVQGFDQWIATGPKSTVRVAYGNNADPATGGPISITAGANHVVLKAVSQRSGGAYRAVARYVPIFIRAAVPPEDAFPPPLTVPGAATLFRRASLDLTVLRDLTPVSGADTLSAALAGMPKVMPFVGWWGETFRAFHNFAGDTNDSGYSAYWSRSWMSPFLQAAHYSGQGDKTAAAIRMARYAIDLHGLVTRGNVAGQGAGQFHGHHGVLFFGAFLLQSPEILGSARLMRSNMNGPYRFTTEADRTKSVAFPDSYYYNRPFFDEDAGKPHCYTDGAGADLGRRYGPVCRPAMVPELMPVLALQNGPGGIDGEGAVLAGLYEDNATAALANADRERVLYPSHFSNPLSAVDRAVYDLMRPLASTAPWTGIPEQINFWDVSSSKFGAGDGTITWNVQSTDQYLWATETVTNRYVRYSIDQLDWQEISGVSITGSQSGMQRTPHYVGFAMESASGKGRFTVNWPYAAGGSMRNVVTPTGTASNAAPSYSGRPTPRIFVPERPAWEGPDALPVGASVPASTVRFLCGVGYPSGYPAPAYPAGFAFQWKLDGAPISGATSREYMRSFTGGGVLTCDVTATNSQGSATVSTAGVTVPAYPAAEAGVVIDTDFGTAFQLLYPSTAAGITVSAATSGLSNIWQPYKVFSDNFENDYYPLGISLSAAGSGALHMNKTASRPRLQVPVYGLTPGQAYRLTTMVTPNEGASGIGGTNSWATNGTFRAGTAANGSQYWSQSIARLDPVTGQLYPYVATVTRDFTATASEMHLTYEINTSTGGGAGGDIYVASLRVEEV